MPPHDPLSPRDGRLGASSAPAVSAREPYYSNEDVRVVHETVLAAEEILPTLPERDRLPTNALFRAAEDVLPRHGYDADESPNISRLLFRIGGMRGDEPLVNKFETILGSMGIELEYTHSQEIEGAAPELPSEFSHSGGSSVGSFPLGMQYHGRRRRNSDILTQQIGEDHQETLPRTRAASFESSVNPGPGLFGVQREQFAHGQQDLGGDGQDFDEPLLDELIQPGETDYTIPDSEFEDGFATQSSLDHPDAEPSRELGMVTAQRQDGRISRAGFGSEAFRNASDTTVHTLDEISEPGADSPPYRTDVDLLEKMVDSFRRTSATTEKLHTWREVAYYTKRDRQIREKYAARLDRDLVVEEVLDIWRDNAGLPKYEHHGEQPTGIIPGTQDPTLDHSIPDEALDPALVRRAERAYRLYTLDKALTHWSVDAKEAKERTEIARRHILRKRYFSAWRTQNSLDKDKIVKFALSSAIRLWQMALATHEEDQEFAIQTRKRTLLDELFETWLQQHRSQVAVAWSSAQIRKTSLQTWTASTRVIREKREDAVYLDTQTSREKSLISWREQNHRAQVLYDILDQQEERHNRQVLLDWQTAARLTKILRESLTERRKRLIFEFLDLWRRKAGEARQQSRAADAMYLVGSLVHWRNETRLRQFQARADEALLTESMYQWILEERLVFFMRYRNESTKSQVLEQLLGGSQEARAERKERERHARDVDKWSAKASFLNLLDHGTQDQLFLQQEADAISAQYLTSYSLSVWSRSLARMKKKQAWANRGAFYVRATNTLQHWRETTKRTKEARLRRTYHMFRRRYKVDQALQCLDKWRADTEAVVSTTWEAEQISATQNQEDLEDMVVHWNAESLKMRAYAEIAEGAFQEVCFGRWREATGNLRVLAIDAEGYDVSNTLQSCLKAWELESVQQRARVTTAMELDEKSNRRLSRHMLKYWQQEALPGGGRHAELQSSYISKASGSRGIGGNLLFPTAQGEASLLGPMMEFDEDADIAYPTPSKPRRRVEDNPQTSPSRRQGQSLRQSSGSGGKDISQPFLTVSRLGGLRPEEPRALAFRPGRWLDTTPQSTPRPTSAAILGTSIASGQPSFFRQRALSGIEEEPRSGSAAKTQGPARLQSPAPTSAFDDEDERRPAATNSPAMPIGFANTPTRRTGIPRSLPLPRRFSTTPRAPLPSPFERQLREEYGGGGRGDPLRTLNIGSARTSLSRQQTPRVTFGKATLLDDEGVADDELEESS